jgi:hypothetical protein
MKSIITRRSSNHSVPPGVRNEADLVTVKEEGIASSRPKKKDKDEQSFLIVEVGECNQEQVVVDDEGGFEKECRFNVDQEEGGDLESVLEAKTDNWYPKAR